MKIIYSEVGGYAPEYAITRHFLSGYQLEVSSDKKRVVTDVHIGKPVITFMLLPKRKHT